MMPTCVSCCPRSPALRCLLWERQTTGQSGPGQCYSHSIQHFWRVLADFAVSVVIPKRAQGVLLTQQPFIAWHVVLSGGTGLRVVKH